MSLTRPLLTFIVSVFQSTEEGERQAAVTSQGRQRLTGAGPGKLLQSCYIQLKKKKNRKGHVDHLRILLLLGFCSVKDFFLL